MQRALIVEDQPGVRRALSEIVRSAFAGLTVETAERRDQALACVLRERFDLALVDLALPDGDGLDVVAALGRHQPDALAVVVTIFDDDAHLFPALQAGAFGYLLKEQPADVLRAQLLRITSGEPPLSPPVARRMLRHFSSAPIQRHGAAGEAQDSVRLTEREVEVLQRVAKGFTLPEIARQFGLSRHTVADHIKSVYRKLDVSSRAEAALQAARLGLVAP